MRKRKSMPSPSPRSLWSGEFDYCDVDTDRWEEGDQTYSLATETGHLAIQEMADHLI
jgi:hypothetical protein